VPEVDDRDTGTDQLHLVHIMGCIYNGRALTVQLKYSLQYQVAALGIHSDCGLIHNNQPGLMDNAAGNVEPP